jgi:hypothetical protein
MGGDAVIPLYPDLLGFKLGMDPAKPYLAALAGPTGLTILSQCHGTVSNQPTGGNRL